MSLETTLTLLVAGGLLAVMGLLWAVVRGTLWLVRRARGTGPKTRHAIPRDPLMPKVARRLGASVGLFRRVGRRIHTRLAYIYSGLRTAVRVQGKPWLAQTSTTLGRFSVTATHSAGTAARTAWRYTSAAILFVAAEMYDLMLRVARAPGPEDPHDGLLRAEGPHLRTLGEIEGGGSH